jgi:hypothetical protein
MADLGDNIGNRLVVDAIPVAGPEAFNTIDVADKVGVRVAPGDMTSAADGVSAIVGKLIEDPVLEIRRSGIDRYVSCDECGCKRGGFTVEVLVLNRQIRIQIQRPGMGGRGERGNGRSDEADRRNADGAELPLQFHAEQDRRRQHGDAGQYADGDWYSDADERDAGRLHEQL